LKLIWPVRKKSVDADVAALRPSELFKFLPECRKPRLHFRIVLGATDQQADALDRALLRARSERPRRCAAEQCYEIAPSKPIELHPLPLARMAA
jgi:hypothetical protein